MDVIKCHHACIIFIPCIIFDQQKCCAEKEFLVSILKASTVLVLEVRYVMSGRPAPNRGKKSHRRGYDPADSYQSSGSSTSSKYGSREPPPPRFLSRQRNGNGRSSSGGDSREYYEEYPSGRKEGGSYKGPGGRGASSTPSGGRSSNLGKGD